MCKYEVQAAHSPHISYNIDKQRLLPSRFEISIEHLPKQYVWYNGAEHPLGKIDGFYLKLEILKAGCCITCGWVSVFCNFCSLGYNTLF